jgi:transposase
MLYVGIDYHKRYAQVNVIDQRGKRRAHVRVANEFGQLERFFSSVGEPCAVALEAAWNWGVLYDWLERIENVKEIQLAHPYRTRAIAAAQVKTDSIDADTLSQLLRAGLIPRAHIPSAETRRLREIVRQRLFLVRLRTMVKNRLHALLDRYHVPVPEVSDLFGKKGRKYLSRVVLPQLAQPLLTQDLRMLELLDGEIKQTEHWLQEQLKGDRRMELLLSVPGLGRLLAAVIGLEIDTIERFNNSSKLVAYAGLAPTTYASGGHVSHGRLMKQSNKWLRWALVEAAWAAVRCDPYFRAQYGMRYRHKGAQTAIVAVARRLAEVIWHVLKEDRPYEIRSVRGADELTSAALAQA